MTIDKWGSAISYQASPVLRLILISWELNLATLLLLLLLLFLGVGMAATPPLPTKAGLQREGKGRGTEKGMCGVHLEILSRV